jgi:Rad3-related DNA helicase
MEELTIPAELKLPKEYTKWWPNQADSVDEIVASGKKVYLLDAPVGSGKSLVAIAAHRRFSTMDEVLGRMTDEEEKIRCIYLTRTIQLQNQILEHFPARMVKGRSNYSCLERPKDFPAVTAADCPGKKCDGCLYTINKRLAVKAPLAVLNDAYYLAEVNGPGQFRDANLVVLDEIDSLESVLMDFIKFTVSERQCKKYGLQPPKNVDSLSEWRSWAQFAQFGVAGFVHDLKSQLPMDFNMWSLTDIDNNRDITRAESFSEHLTLFINEVNDSWILDYDPKTKAGWMVTFKPVTVAAYAEKYLFRFGKRFLGMSGTILDPQILADDLGIEDYEYRRLDSTFPVANRLIRYRPVANLTYNQMATERPKLLAEVARLVNLYPNDNVLVHTVSYPIANYLMEMLPTAGVSDSRLITHNGDNRADQLDLFKNSRGLIMISPSFDRGVDLPGDECLVPGTLVRTSKGYKSIEDIKVGDRVLTHKGKFRKVTATLKREYKGLLSDIETYGGYHHKITGEHPVRVTSGFPRKVAQEVWLPAKQLTKGVRSILPIPQENRCFKTLGVKYPTGHRSSSHVSQAWESSPAFWRLAGLWAAEGNICISKRPPVKHGGAHRAVYEVVFNFGKDEKETLARETCQLVNSILGNKTPEPYVYGSNGCRVAFKNAPFAIWLKRNVGLGAHNKKVPVRISLGGSQEEKRAFVSGVFDGDGYHNEDSYELGIVAPQLALGVRDLLLSLGQPTGVNERNRVWRVRYNDKQPKKNYARITKNKLLTRIRSVKTEQYSGPVFNLSVEKDESYCLVGLCVHNCRVQIICKMPYMSLNDKQVKARMAMVRGQRWYNLRAIQTVMQMSGRIVRSPTDVGTTYILDRQFDSLFARTRQLIPKWWQEAIVREEIK